ncbi:cation-translocating P-type ATPase [Methanofollis formosanus]|uniref:Cation-translocating P-type ATPase n=1 Tax=Methanofollis formosanus TaxID=299308 RepID=A0A8G1A4M2_9EURY|nr:cation-translocating P-type ATPase [Methanofollis formosanus]QYZ80334.1 cation-translocating P-type ATPase [Methanofollis formosanus]
MQRPSWCTGETARIGLAVLLLAVALAGGYLRALPSLLVTALTIASLLITATPFVVETVRGLARRERNVGELATLAIAAAVLIGEYTAAAEVGLIMAVGEMAEEFAFNRSKRDIEGIAVANPGHALRKDGDGWTEVRTDDLVPGDVVLVRPGDLVPVDGTVVVGSSGIDESRLTGESTPVEKGVGGNVYAGTVNLDGTLEVRVSRAGEDSTYGKIVTLVKEAGERRPPARPFIDHFASVYTPVVLAVAGAVWAVTGDLHRAITLLIVACPCALLLATPSAVLAATGAAARKGVLIKGGEYLEAAARVDTCVFDKTGTLTRGIPAVTGVVPADGQDEHALLGLAAAAERGSPHPFARAVMAAAERAGIEVRAQSEARLTHGMGVEALTPAGRVVVGNALMMEQAGVAIPPGAAGTGTAIARTGATPLYVGRDGAFAGLIRVEDQVRPEAPGVVSAIRAEGAEKVVILTGDHEAAARDVAAQIGIGAAEVKAGLFPAEKLEQIRTLQAEGHTVCFVGDGTNDGPALAQAEIGVAIGSREDTVALETSDVVLMRGGIAALPWFLHLGRQTSRTITANVVFALGFAAVMAGCAAGGLITPATAAIAHQFGTIIVLANSVRLAGADRDFPARVSGKTSDISHIPNDLRDSFI